MDIDEDEIRTFLRNEGIPDGFISPRSYLDIIGLSRKIADNNGKDCKITVSPSLSMSRFPYLTKENDCYIIDMSIGVYIRTHAILMLLIKSHNSTFNIRNLFSPLDVDDNDNLYIPTRLKPLFEIGSPECRHVFGLYNEEFKYCADEFCHELLATSTTYAFLFLLFHELAHALYHHEFLLYAKEVVFDYGGFFTKGASEHEILHGMECHADWIAAESLVQFVDWEAPDDEKLFHLYAMSFGVTSLISSLEVTRQFIAIKADEYHPSPLVRHALFVDSVSKTFGSKCLDRSLWKRANRNADIKVMLCYNRLEMEYRQYDDISAINPRKLRPLCSINYNANPIFKSCYREMVFIAKERMHRLMHFLRTYKEYAEIIRMLKSAEENINRGDFDEYRRVMAEIGLPVSGGINNIIGIEGNLAKVGDIYNALCTSKQAQINNPIDFGDTSNCLEEPWHWHAC